MSTPTSVNLTELDFGVRPCPLCGGMGFTHLASQDRNLLGIATVGCNRCGLVQTNPRPSAAGLNRFYRDHYRIFYQGATAPDQAYIASLNKDVRLAYTAGFFKDTIGLKRGEVVLDFGCGEGSLFAALRRAGFTGAFYGVELNASFGEYASRYGNARVSNSIRSREPVDLVVMNHVLEHLYDPIGTLRELGKLLKSSGHLYIDVPDAEEYDKIYDLHIAHIYHFTARTLRSLVERAGFVVSRIEKHRPPHHPHSVRLVATLGTLIGPDQFPAERQEALAWSAVRSAGRYRNTVRLRLRRINLLRKLYRTLRWSSVDSTSV